MKPHRKYLLIASLLLLLFASTGIAYASSSTFFTQAQKFITQNCNKKIIADPTPLLCYLFNKSQEQDTQITNINAALSPIPTQITALQASTSALNNAVNILQQNQSGKALKLYDAQDHELGIMIDYQTVFNTTLNKIIRINGNGFVGVPAEAWYATNGCSGTTYITQIDQLDPSLYIYNIGMVHNMGGVQMEVDTTVPVINTLTILSYRDTDGCHDISHQQTPLQEQNVFTLKQVTSPYQEPVPLPLKIKYQ